MKLKKKSGLMGAVIALSCASLVSVGFASWVISQGDQKTVDGTVFVDSVQNDTHTISEQAIANNKLSFAAPETATSGWLTAQGTYDAEQLSVVVTFKVSNIPASYTGATVTLAAQGNTSGYNSAVDGGFIVEPANMTVTANAVADSFVAASPAKVDASNNPLGTQSYTATLTYSWGSKFGGVNPYTYYNDGKTAAGHPETGADAELTWAAIAERDLGLLNTHLTGVTYLVTIAAA